MSETDLKAVKGNLVKFLEDEGVKDIRVYENVVYLSQEDISIALDKLPSIKVIVSPCEKYGGNYDEAIKLLKVLCRKN